MAEPMETMTKALARLKADGFELDVQSVPGARLRCPVCGHEVDAADVTVVETVRFEGRSDPEDEEILLALRLPCGHGGLFSAGYGPEASAEDAEVLRALPRSPT